jgi:hypothetical protein
MDRNNKNQTKINEIENDNKKLCKNQQNKKLFFEKINKIDKPLGNLTKREKINKIKHEKGDVTTNTYEIQKIIRETFKTYIQVN